jgi:hypothetical protein
VQTYKCLRVESHKLWGLASEETYVSGDTVNDDLLLAGGLDSSTDISVVPGVDLTAPANDGGVGVRVSDLSEERTVEAWRAQGNE